MSGTEQELEQETGLPEKPIASSFTVEFDQPVEEEGQGGDEGEQEEAKSISDEDLLAEFERQKQALEREKKLREEAERRALAAQAAAREAAAAAQSHAALQTLRAAIEKNEAEVAALEEKIGKAYEDGDYKEAVRLTRQLSRIEATLQLTRERMAALESGTAAPSQPPVYSDVDLSMFEPAQAQHIRQNFLPEEQRWLAQHPDAVRDPELYKRLASAHHYALMEGYERASPEYFKVLEQAYAKYKGIEVPSQPRAESSKRSPPVMPVTRNSPTRSTTTTSRRPGVVHLTPEEKEAADFMLKDSPTQGYVKPNGERVLSRYEIYSMQKNSPRVQEMMQNFAKNKWR